jgi:hypothetical protein
VRINHTAEQCCAACDPRTHAVCVDTPASGKRCVVIKWQDHTILSAKANNLAAYRAAVTRCDPNSRSNGVREVSSFDHHAFVADKGTNPARAKTVNVNTPKQTLRRNHHPAGHDVIPN